MTERRVKYLALAALVLTLANLVLSYVGAGNRDDVTQDLLSFGGFNAVVIPPPWFFFAYYGAQIVALLGLLTPFLVARYLFLANIAFFAVASLFTGIAISLPLEVFIATAIAYIYGAIIFLLVVPSGRGAERGN